MENGMDFSKLDSLATLNPALIATVDTGQESNETEIEGEEKQNIIEEVENLSDFAKVPQRKAAEQEGVIPEEEEELETPDGNNDSEQTGDEGFSPVKALAEFGKEAGIFDYEDDKFEDKEEFLLNQISSKIDKGIDTGINAYKAEIPATIKELLENYEDGVPLDQLVWSKSREMEYKALDPTKIKGNTEIQEQLVGDYLALQDYTEEEITRKLERMKASGILEDEAEETHQKLIKYQEKYQETLKTQAVQRREEDQREFDRKVKEIENTINTAQEILPGVSLSKEDKQKLFEGYTKMDKNGQTELTRKMKADPLTNLKIAQLYLLYDGNLSGLEKKVKTAVAQKTKETVTTYKETPVGKLDINAWKRAMAKYKQK